MALCGSKREGRLCLLGGGLQGMNFKVVAIGSTIAIVASSILQVSDVRTHPDSRGF